MNKRVVTFGEIMLRLAPNGYYRFFQNDQLQATFGGGEANVAVSLANYGLDSVYVTKLPGHAIGQAAVNALRSFGVDTSHLRPVRPALPGGEQLQPRGDGGGVHQGPRPRRPRTHRHRYQQCGAGHLSSGAPRGGD